VTTNQNMHTEHTFESQVLDNTRPVWLHQPAVDGAPTHLAVFLDGDFFIDHFGAPEAMTTLQRSGTLPPTWSLYVPAGERTRRWPESFCDADFATFLCDELVPWALTHTGATADPVLVGVSLTGLSAAHAALSHPGTFSRVLCLSGSFWWDDAHLADTVSSFPPSPTAFHLTVGDQETATDVDHGHGLIQARSQIDGVQAMHRALTTHGTLATYSEYSGGHDAESWLRELPGDLEAVWRLGEG
jgi:enterochelin esterase family protein